MNKQYQIIEIPSANTATTRVTDRTRSDYKRVTGLFFASDDDAADILQTCRLSINGKEVLPQGTDVDLFLATPYCSRKEVMLDLDNEQIEAENSPIDIEVAYNSNVHPALRLYLLLSKD